MADKYHRREGSGCDHRGHDEYESTSEKHLITFVPELVAKLLPTEDVVLLKCGSDSNVDDCNGVVDPDDDGFTWPECSSDSSFCASHYNVWGAIGDDSDQDIFDITLKNDWFLDHMEFTYKDHGRHAEWAVRVGPRQPALVGEDQMDRDAERRRRVFDRGVDRRAEGVPDK